MNVQNGYLNETKLWYSDEDITTAQVDAVVNPVNTVGVMGAGLAAQFKRLSPEYFKDYQLACKRRDLRQLRGDPNSDSCDGFLHHYILNDWDEGDEDDDEKAIRPAIIISAPTKQHWRDRSSFEFVRDSIRCLVDLVEYLGVRSVGVPPLGCGLGGLDAELIHNTILKEFDSISDQGVLDHLVLFRFPHRCRLEGVPLFKNDFGAEEAIARSLRVADVTFA